MGFVPTKDMQKKLEKLEDWFFIRFSTLRIFHEKQIKLREGEGDLHIIIWEKALECSKTF